MTTGIEVGYNYYKIMTYHVPKEPFMVFWFEIPVIRGVTIESNILKLISVGIGPPEIGQQFGFYQNL